MLRGTTQLHDKVLVVVLGCLPWWVVLNVYAVHITESHVVDYEVVHRGPDDSTATLQGYACLWLNTCAPVEHMHVARPHGGLQHSPPSTGTPK